MAVRLESVPNAVHQAKVAALGMLGRTGAKDAVSYLGLDEIPDADAYQRYTADVMRQCRFIRDFLLRTPPDPTSFRPRDLKELAYLGGKFLALGEEWMYDTIRFYTMSVAEYLDEYFETDVIKSALSGSGIIGTALGVHSPGTSYVLLHHYMGDVDGNIGAWGFARGGTGAVANAISKAFLSYGGVDNPAYAGGGEFLAVDNLLFVI